MKAVNLIPSEERRSGGAGLSAGRSGGGVFVVLGLLGGLVVLAFLYGLADHQISSRRTEVASLNARAQQAQARASRLAAYTSFEQMREQRQQAVTALVNSRFDWAQTFRELGRVLPAGQVSLTSIGGTVGSGSGSSSGGYISSAGTSPASPSSGSASKSGSAGGSTSGSAVTSATPPGSIPVFTLSGCATSQSEVALMLDRLRLIDGVSEVTLQSSTQSSSGGGGGGGGGSGCEGSHPTFAAQVIFDALPTVPTSGPSGSAATVAAGAGSTSTGAAR